MTLSSDEAKLAAASLHHAEATRKQTGLLSLQHPHMDMDDAYAVQAALVAAKLAEGRKVIGWKVGLTSKAMQKALGIDIPDSGVLLDDMLFENGAAIPPDRFIEPRIEAEIAFFMKAPLSGGEATREDVLAATEYVAPSLEILDTRIVRADPESGKARNVCDTIADNAANAGVVVGSERHPPDSLDLRRVGAAVSRNGEVEETGLGAGVLGDPLESMVWLARRMAQYGQRIEAGHLVLSGSFIRPIECPPGTEIAADFGEFGSVNLVFH